MALSASERLATGLTLHRSEETAHSLEIFDHKGLSRASARARGRCEGFQSKANSLFRPLGGPVKNERIVELNAVRLAKVEKQCAMVVANVGSQHHEPRPRRSDMERPADWGASAKAKGSGDGGLRDDEAEKDLDDERAQQQQLARQPHGLFGRDLPRCRCQGRRHAMDGFSMLKRCVRESESRLQQVRTDTTGAIRGFDYGATMIEAMLPPRERYPPVAVPGLAEGGLSLSARTSSKRPNKFSPAPPTDPRPSALLPPPPHSARAAVPPFHHLDAHVLSPEKRSGRAPANRLQSLDEFVASAGPALGLGGRPERSEALKQINELLGLEEKSASLKLPQEELTGVGRRGRPDIRRRIEKSLDQAWVNRAFLKQCISAPKDAAERLAQIERTLRDEAGAGEASDDARAAGMAKLATVERYLRDLSAFSEERGGEAERTAGGGAGAAGAAAASASEAAGGAGAAEWTAEGGAESSRRRRERLEAEEAAQYATKYAAVARLRSALHAYQASRDDKRSNLQETLVSMDINRPNTLRRRAALGTASPDAKATSAAARNESDCEDRMQRQFMWYRDLLCSVQDDKQNLPRVAYFIFDCVKQVLEYREEFGREAYFAMLEQIQDFEYSRVIAGLVVKMIRGIEGLTVEDLIAWFEQNRGDVPPHILEVVEEQRGTGRGGADLNKMGVTLRPPQADRSRRFPTFATEVP